MASVKQRMTFNMGGDYRWEELEGIKHLVVPIAMIEEGVWEGSNGPLYYPDDEIAASYVTYNGRPIVCLHPQDEDGEPISACTPEVFNTSKIGTIFNVTIDTKQRCEGWINPEKADSVDKRIMPKLLAKENVEVSTGLRSNNEDVKGEFNGKPYVGIVRNILGDHLAVLPDQFGAYSVKDGGGTFVVNTSKKQPESLQVLTHLSATKALEKAGLTMTQNELSFGEIGQQLGQLLASKFGKPGQYWDGYICGIYKEYAVFSTPYSISGGDTSPRYSKYVIGYTVKDDQVSLKGTATEVEEVTQYQTVKGKTVIGNGSGQLVSNKREAKMSLDRKAHINGLITAGVCAESNRDKLEELSDEQLELLVVPKTTTTQNAGAGAGATAPIVPPPAKPPTLQDVLKHGDPKERGAVQQLVANFQKSRQKAIDTIVANSDKQFEAKDFEDVEKWDIETLEKMAMTLNARRRGPDDDDSDDGARTGNDILRGVDYTLNAGTYGARKLTKNDLDELPTLTPSSEIDDEEEEAEVEEQVA